jgi:hypothetical protein
MATPYVGSGVRRTDIPSISRSRRAMADPERSGRMEHACACAVVGVQRERDRPARQPISDVSHRVARRAGALCDQLRRPARTFRSTHLGRGISCRQAARRDAGRGHTRRLCTSVSSSGLQCTWQRRDTDGVFECALLRCCYRVLTPTFDARNGRRAAEVWALEHLLPPQTAKR